MFSSAGANPLALHTDNHEKSSDDRPLCLENPRPGGAESTLTENAASPFHAEPEHLGYLEELPDGLRIIIRAHDETEREVRVGHWMPVNARQWRRLVDGITDATSLPVRLVIRRRLASGSFQETPWTPFAAKPDILRAEVGLAICFALLPYFGGFLVIGTRNIGSLALAGAVICVLCTSAAYLMRRQRDPVGAKHRLMVDPILYGFEFAFTVIVIRYVFMR